MTIKSSFLSKLKNSKYSLKSQAIKLIEIAGILGYIEVKQTPLNTLLETGYDDYIHSLVLPKLKTKQGANILFSFLQSDYDETIIRKYEPLLVDARRLGYLKEIPFDILLMTDIPPTTEDLYFLKTEEGIKKFFSLLNNSNHLSTYRVKEFIRIAKDLGYIKDSIPINFIFDHTDLTTNSDDNLRPTLLENYLEESVYDTTYSALECYNSFSSLTTY